MQEMRFHVVGVGNIGPRCSCGTALLPSMTFRVADAAIPSPAADAAMLFTPQKPQCLSTLQGGGHSRRRDAFYPRTCGRTSLP